MKEHAFFAPSMAHVWRTCSLAPHMAAAFPEAGGDAAAEGALAHALAAAALNPARPVPADAGADMVRGALLWSETIGEVPAASVETRLAGAESDYFGTADYATRDVVADYKFGRTPVEAIDNPQLLAYAELLDPAPRPLTIVIVQPRATHHDGPVRQQRLTIEEVAAHFDAARAARHAARTDPRATPGAHCLHCPGRVACRGLRDAVFEDMSHLEGPDLATTLTRVREHAKMVEGLMTGVEAEAEARLRRGEVVGTWEMRPVRSGALRWTLPNPADIITAVALDTGKNIGRIEVGTPTQAIEEHGIPISTVNRIAARAPGKPTLTFVNPKSVLKP